ncbi:hypothetical protein C0584_04640 [Candidatus Parcubacteria bacterium]|nr:MAG: hypothetical protein C0584_04640 [Candidatus Parcubacteria bacterium]
MKPLGGKFWIIFILIVISFISFGVLAYELHETLYSIFALFITFVLMIYATYNVCREAFFGDPIDNINLMALNTDFLIKMICYENGILLLEYKVLIEDEYVTESKLYKDRPDVIKHYKIGDTIRRNSKGSPYLTLAKE